MVSHMGFLTNNLVLYCYRDDKWKLADFGISTEGTSKHPQPTMQARGTPRYRAPELLEEEAAFTNKVDIWSLGCILHELTTLRSAFHEDWKVQQYAMSTSPLPIHVPFSSALVQHHVSENIRELLHRDPSKRPRAATVCRLFSF